jgi:hypothetical protein
MALNLEFKLSSKATPSVYLPSHIFSARREFYLAKLSVFPEPIFTSLILGFLLFLSPLPGCLSKSKNNLGLCLN